MDLILGICLVTLWLGYQILPLTFPRKHKFLLKKYLNRQGDHLFHYTFMNEIKSPLVLEIVDSSIQRHPKMPFLS